MYISGHIGSGNGSWPVRQQAITLTSCDFYVNWTLKNNIHSKHTKLFCLEVHQEMSCEMVSILFMPQRVNVDFRPTAKHMGPYIAILFSIYMHGMTFT